MSINCLNQCPEIELLLCCCRAQISPQQSDQLTRVLEATPDLDWPCLLKLAQRHAVLPLLYQQLQMNCSQLVPPAVLAQLQSEFKANAYKNIRFSYELGRLLNLFQAHQIPVLAFKGPLLGELAYADYALRQFMDLDLLVREADVARVGQLLVAQGYKSRHNLNPAQLSRYIRLGSELDFWHSPKQLMVDLHWSILPKGFSFSPATDLIWANPQMVVVDNQSVSTLSLENLLLFLCAHAAKHNWDTLSLVCDIAALLHSQPEIDWQSVRQQAGKLGSLRMLRLGLYLAHIFLEAELPVALRNEIEADTQLPALAQEIQKILFPATVPLNSPLSHESLLPLRLARMYQTCQRYQQRILAWFARDRVYLGSMERWRDRLWFWSDVLIPTPLELVAFPLPDWLFFLYYPVRPLRLAAKYLSGKYRQSDLT